MHGKSNSITPIHWPRKEEMVCESHFPLHSQSQQGAINHCTLMSNTCVLVLCSWLMFNRGFYKKIYTETCFWIENSNLIFELFLCAKHRWAILIQAGDSRPGWKYENVNQFKLARNGRMLYNIFALFQSVSKQFWLSLY